ncbi:hypothetical protein Q3A66_20375 [Hymenobacter sp. BT770]|uniref:hypothetical protein n=1 Tax=Hymenobacter sp. BT770 TaxID=2886942 RepID=UPI001D1050A7|nr:hypothetical protein [Hymenobacter sp. BT770]MCC3155393.1 hypothetical protein [Hymenobacter sp. BT770]MDO3417430.1 hypothetical protein [Hymenobacter sp. BT770]
MRRTDRKARLGGVQRSQHLVNGHLSAHKLVQEHLLVGLGSQTGIAGEGQGESNGSLAALFGKEERRLLVHRQEYDFPFANFTTGHRTTKRNQLLFQRINRYFQGKTCADAG